MISASERDLERVQLRRGKYQAEIIGEWAARLKFLDEAGSSIAMTRLYGRAAPGERVIDNVPPQLWGKYHNVSRAFAVRHFCADDH